MWNSKADKELKTLVATIKQVIKGIHMSKNYHWQFDYNEAQGHLDIKQEIQCW